MSFFGSTGVNTVDYVSKVLGSTGFTEFLKDYNLIIDVILALLTIIAIVAVAINAARLSAAGDNPSKRSLAQRGMLISGICLALMGGIDTIFAIVLHLFFPG